MEGPTPPVEGEVVADVVVIGINRHTDVRMRAINHYRLDGDDPSIVARGHTVLDLGIAKQISHTLELNFSADNLTNRDYWETQNFFESRVTPDALAVSRIHATPAYPLTAVSGVDTPV